MIESLIEDMTFDRDSVPPLNAERLKQLQDANLSRATPASIGLKINRVDGADPVECDRLVKQVEAYLSHFVDPTIGCPNCGRKHSFEWGFVHGHGHCVSCHYPGVAKHRIDGVGDLNGIVLWEHPSTLVLEDTPETK